MRCDASRVTLTRRSKKRLATARHTLTPREHKLVLYVMSMIQPEDEAFKLYRINVADFAAIAGVELVVIDSDTKLRRFKQELEWNDVACGLRRGFVS